MHTRCSDAESHHRLSTTMRERWRAASLKAGWPFPNDWNVLPVELVCHSLTEGRNLLPALQQLGSARGEQCIALNQALRDVAALYAAMFPTDRDEGGNSLDALPTSWAQAVATGWGETAAAQIGGAKVVDAFTGLCTAAYFRTRLGEVYQACEAEGVEPANRYTLALISVDLRPAMAFDRTLAMILVADVLAHVFHSGESRALLAPSTAAVLSARHARLRARTTIVRELVQQRLSADLPRDVEQSVLIRLEPLPAHYEAAGQLIGTLGS
jgi:hypothetical protein